MSSELKYKIADKVVFQKVKTALGKNKSFIGLILKALDWLKAEVPFFFESGKSGIMAFFYIIN